MRAERITVHASQVIPVPGIPPESASLLACGVLTGVGAVLNTARVEAGSTVAVVGTGGVGLNSVQGAVLAGAELVVAIDLVDERLAQAAAFGATHVFSAAAVHVPGEVAELTGGRGLDCVVVTAGSAAAVEQGIALLARGGTAVLVGMPGGATAAVDPDRIADRGLRIVGSKVGSARPQLDIPMLADLYRGGRLKLDELISHRYPLDAVNDALASAGQGAAPRPVVVV